jgi:hypothetical protein
MYHFKRNTNDSRGASAPDRIQQLLLDASPSSSTPTTFDATEPAASANLIAKSRTVPPTSQWGQRTSSATICCCLSARATGQPRRKQQLACAYTSHAETVDYSEGDFGTRILAARLGCAHCEAEQ